MYSFRNLQKARKKNIGGREIRLAVLGNCATQLLSQAVEGYAKLSNLNMRVYDSDYGQLNEQLLDPSSEVYSFNAGIILLWLCTEKIYENYLDMPLPSRSSLADYCIQKIKRYYRTADKTYAGVL
jgi:predicted enzyme involved in methoxymalonyl-ACP biosynthesis